MIRALVTGEAPQPLPEDAAAEAARDILDRDAALLADFKQMRDGLKKMLHALHQEMADNAAKGLTMGEILEIDQNLRSTTKATPAWTSPTWASSRS